MPDEVRHISGGDIASIDSPASIACDPSEMRRRLSLWTARVSPPPNLLAGLGPFRAPDRGEP